jgi:glycosyltransferase involved in cell wall biosynthesis
MNIVLLMLSGDAAKAREVVSASYPNSAVKTITRQDLGVGSLAGRLQALRRMRPDVVVIATERLSWQRGAGILMTFGALGGAAEVMIIDAHGGRYSERRASLLLKAPIRLIKESISSSMTMNNSRRGLQRLERQVKAERKLNLSGTRDPRVVFLRSTPGPGTQAGGASSHIKGVVEALAQLGANVKIVSNDVIAGLENTRVPIEVLESQAVGTTRAIFDISSNLSFTDAALPLIQEFQPDIIYQRYARFSWTGVAASVQTAKPLFLEYNGSEVWVGRHWDQVGSLDLLARYEHLNLAGASRIFVVSEVERRNLEAAGVPSSKIVVNPNGVDPETFHPHVGGAEVRRELGIEGRETVVGFVGTFGPWHGVRVLAEAIKKIPDSKSIRYLMVGSGSLHAEVEQLLAAESLSRKVIFTGAVAHEQVPALLNACDVLVAPHVPLEDGSAFFGSPTKLFEYMAMGKGIVASRLGQIGDILEHEMTALLVAPGDVAQLAWAIEQMHESSELRTKLGTNAREVVLREHTWRHNAERVLNEYRSLEGST